MLKDIGVHVSPLFENITYRSRAGLARGLRRKGGLGFIPRRDSAEERFFRSIAKELRGATVYDVGGYHGILTIFFASHAERVVTFEPNPHSRKIIAANVAANRFTSRVTLLPCAAGSSAAEMTLRVPRNAAALGTLDAGLSYEDCDSVVVRVEAIDTIVAEHRLPSPQFIKLDVEGFEIEALRGMRKTLAGRPRIYVEIHGQGMSEKRRNAEGVLKILADAGYERPIHVESGRRADPNDNAWEGHIYAT